MQLQLGAFRVHEEIRETTVRGYVRGQIRETAKLLIAALMF
jgi:hypothetical protein